MGEFLFWVGEDFGGGGQAELAPVWDFFVGKI